MENLNFIKIINYFKFKKLIFHIGKYKQEYPFFKKKNPISKLWFILKENLIFFFPFKNRRLICDIHELNLI